MVTSSSFSTALISTTPLRHLLYRHANNSTKFPKCSAAPPTPVNNLQVGFDSITETPNPITVPFTKPVPFYLSEHVYYHNGPAIYQVPHRDGTLWQATHWFDAIGIVHAFSFDSTLTELHYRSRNNNNHLVDTIRSTNGSDYIEPLVGKPASTSWVQKLGRLRPFTTNPNTGKISYNNVVSLQTIPGKGPLNARTDINCAQTLDPITLQPRDSFTFADFHPSLVGDFSCAHGKYDRDTDEYFNFVYGITGLIVDYKVFRIGPTGRTDILASFQDYPNYLHSFALTQNYIIMILWPCQYNLFKLIATKSIVDAIGFPSDVPTKFVVISRNQAGVVAIYEHDQFFSFHVVNAYEQDDDIIIDLAYYDDPSILEHLHIDHITSGGKIAKAKPVRFTLPDLSRVVAIGRSDQIFARKKELAQIDIELATVSPQHEAKSYQYMYGVSDNGCDEFHGDIVKLNVHSGEVIRWRSDNTLTNEPVFAPDPTGVHEDDGSLLVVTLDLKTEASSLVILDAKTMRETTRAALPSRIPLGFHGTLLRVPSKRN